MLALALLFGSFCGHAFGECVTIDSLDQLERIPEIIESQPVDLNPYIGEQVTAYKIRYTSDDCEVVGYISAPKDYLEKEYPVLIFNRGGNREFGKNDPNIAGLSTLGYILLASQYRGADGGTGTDQFGGDDVNDVLKLIDIAEKLSFAQKGGVYMLGASRGGMMTYIACRKDTRIKAAAVLSGISDAVSNYTDREDNMKRVYVELIGGTPEQMPDEYERRSAIKWADEIDVPLLIVHGGESDRRVKTQQAIDMAAELEKHGKTYSLILYEDAGHSLPNSATEDAIRWFEQYPLH